MKTEHAFIYDTETSVHVRLTDGRTASWPRGSTPCSDPYANGFQAAYAWANARAETVEVRRNYS